MANTTTSPNMNLPVPTVAQDPGPDWATNVDASLNIIDSHNHSSGQGVAINPDGININTDLPYNGNNATTVKSVIFQAQAAPLSGSSPYIGCAYVSGKDLYYNDEDGNQVRITQGGSVAGSTGTITGLPSGTASASFAASTFTFSSATNTPANMAVGPLIIGANIANSKTVTIAPSNSLASNYGLTLPGALPGSANNIQACDSSGNLSFVPPDGTSFGVSGGTFQVLNGGITPAKLAAANLVSVNSGNFSSATSVYTDICSLSFTGSGRPIFLTFSPGGGTSEGTIANGAAAQCGIRIRRGDGTIIGVGNFVQTGHTMFSLAIIDQSPIVGTTSYTAQAAGESNQGVSITNYELVAVEL